MEGKPEGGPKSFIEATRESPPSPALVQAVEFVIHRNRALDLGAGALSDARFLRSSGFFEVVAVDKDPEILREAVRVPDDHVEVTVSSFEDFEFPPETFDLINAQDSLPFIPKESFNEVFERAKVSLKPGGIFVGNFFGPNHGWNKSASSGMPKETFHSLEEIQELLQGMEVINIWQIEENKKPVIGEPTNWHTIYFIARRL